LKERLTLVIARAAQQEWHSVVAITPFEIEALLYPEALNSFL
jgi:hypothetical protein